MAELNDDRLDLLLDALADPDPQIRDEDALPTLAGAIELGELSDAQCTLVAARMLDHLRHDQIQARTFAPLVLGVLVEHGYGGDSWFDQVRDWYLAETDLRGHDPQLGWLHAVAHGADFFGAVAHARVRPAADVLDVLVDRLLAPADTVWRDQEDVRVAYAMALCLVHGADAIGRLDRVSTALEGIDGPPPVWAANTLHTLQALAIGLEQQILFNGEPIELPDLSAARTRVLTVIRSTQPWFWRSARD